jgi:hypothetical protein
MHARSTSEHGPEELEATSSEPTTVSQSVPISVAKNCRLIAGTVGVAKKKGFSMSLWLHGQEDYISEAGAMNVWIIKQAEDGCKSLPALRRPFG